MMNLDEAIAVNEQRALIYKQLSICYYLPEQEMLDLLPALDSALSRVCPGAVSEISAMRQESDLDQLKIDFSQLFVGPFRLAAAPYGSVYLEGQRTVMGASTVDVENQYSKAGLDLSQSLNDAPDHIAVELEFLYYLVYKEMEASDSADMDAGAIWLQRQQTFLSRHLGRWVAKFSQTVEEGAKTEFYKHLARATRIFVQADQIALAGGTESHPAITSLN